MSSSVFVLSRIASIKLLMRGYPSTFSSRRTAEMCIRTEPSLSSDIRSSGGGHKAGLLRGHLEWYGLFPFARSCETCNHKVFPSASEFSDCQSSPSFGHLKSTPMVCDPLRHRTWAFLVSMRGTCG